MKRDPRRPPTISRSKLTATAASTVRTPRNRLRSAVLLALVPLGVVALSVFDETNPTESMFTRPSPAETARG